MGVVLETDCYVKAITKETVVLVSNYVVFTESRGHFGNVTNRIIPHISLGEGIERIGTWKVKQLKE